MKIGIIDADNYERPAMFPNLSLMKIAAFHKSKGDNVEWYQPLITGHCDRVYIAKVFSTEYTPGWHFPISADEIVKGGSGFALSTEGGREAYDKSKDPELPGEIEKMFPDYSIYQAKKAYGFLTRGCPRNCPFCHTTQMQGAKVKTVHEVGDFWNGQKEIVLLDPNITASADFFRHVEELRKTGAWVNFSQGLDARLLTKEKIEAINELKIRQLHIAWDNPKEDLSEHLERVKKNLKHNRRDNIVVYILTNYNSSHEEDMKRIKNARSLGSSLM